MPRFEARLPSAIVMVLIAAQVSCMTPRRPISDPAKNINGGPRKIWVTRTDGKTLVIYAPQVVQDTLLTGWAEDGHTSIGFPMSQVKTVSARHESVSRTILLFASLSILGLIAIIRGGHSSDTQIIPED